MKRGWYLMHRGWLDSGDFKPGPFCEAMAFQWSIDRAAWEPHLQWFNGAQHSIERGEFITSYRKLAEAFGWSLNRVRGFAERMERCGKWSLIPAQEGAHPPTRLKVCNYALYQTIPKRADTGADTPADTPSDTGADTPSDTQQNEELTAGNEGKGITPSSHEDSGAVIDAWQLAAERQSWPRLRGSKGSAPGSVVLSRHLQGKLNARLREEGLGGVLAAIARAEAAKMICGPAPPNWWSFSALVSAEKFTSLMDGKYEKQFTGNAPRPSNWGGALELLRDR